MSADGSITNLSDAVAARGALPMPVAPEPQALSETRLAEIRNRRIDEVTAGPWLVADGEDRRPVVYVELPAGGVRVLFSGAASEADAQFVASARRSVQDLLDEVDRLRAEIASLNESLSLAAGALRAKGSPSGSYPPALPWAALMDTEDLTEFLDELADAATTNADVATRLAEVERACGTWRLIAEAQHGHNTAPGPDAMTAVFSPVASLREPEGEHYAAVHHSYRLGHDLPETGGASAQAPREPEPAKCRCDELDADPYACEADDCSGYFSELNPFGGGPVHGHDAKVSRKCGQCDYRTSVWHVDDGSAEEELHGHVVRVHGSHAVGGTPC